MIFHVPQQILFTPLELHKCNKTEQKQEAGTTNRHVGVQNSSFLRSTHIIARTVILAKYGP